ncbi:MAG: hypothetical protein H6829_07320 [Planctomycetes bacterium]|nr:hypothetical protein [Planctomycetota bacterium]
MSHHAALLTCTGFGSVGSSVFWFGLGFVAHHGYGFSQATSLVLYAVLGGFYVAGSLLSEPWIRAGRARRSARAQLAWILVAEALVATLPVLVHAAWALWVGAIAVSFLSALMWPLIESYLTAGHQGAGLRTKVAHFNLVWMTATLLPMFLVAPFVEHHARLVLLVLTAACLLCLTVLPRMRRNPQDHDPVETAPASPRYVALLRSSRFLLPTSYTLLSVIGPLMPYRLEQLGVAVHWQMPLTAIWMGARVLALLAMWRLPAWHGSWSTLLVAATCLTLGFGGIVLAQGIVGLCLSMAAFGIGAGAVYYAALYYAMSVGHGAVDAGGTHEALIGVGYTLGPLTAWAGFALAGPALVVGLSWAVVGLASSQAVRPFVAERRASRATLRG